MASPGPGPGAATITFAQAGVEFSLAFCDAREKYPYALERFFKYFFDKGYLLTF